MDLRSVIFIALLIIGRFCLAQNTTVVEDFKPSSVNQPGKQFPEVNSEGIVRVCIEAPQANRVQLDIGAVKYNLVKDEYGLWSGESAPQDEGFHYYQLNIDGASVPDPGSREIENPRQGPFGDPKANHDEIKAAGMNAHFYVSPLTAHEWQSWRRGLYQFAPLIFNE
jgi:hypothetical protein